MGSRDLEIDWHEAQCFLRERIAAELHRDDRDVLEDLTQQSLVRLVRAVRRAPPENLRGLMHAIARRTCIDHARARERWRLLVTNAGDSDLDPEALSAADTDPLGDPADRLRFIVMEFFRTRRAACLELAGPYFEGLDWQAVAVRLGRSHAAVRQQWSRCVRHLRDAARQDPGWLRDWLDEG